MYKLIIHMILNTEDEKKYQQVKEALASQDNLNLQDLSFSPMRPYYRFADYGELSITLKIPKENFEVLKQYLSTYWQGEYEDDIETDQIMATLFNPYVYYMNLQIL